MQAKAEIYGQLVRQCRVLRMSPDVDRARAALDVEQELVKTMSALGLPLPEQPMAARRGRRPRQQAALVSGGAA
jgi:hypothetical protein